LAELAVLQEEPLVVTVEAMVAQPDTEHPVRELRQALRQTETQQNMAAVQADLAAGLVEIQF
jgi:hypothetical protein